MEVYLVCSKLRTFFSDIFAFCWASTKAKHTL